MTRAQPMPIEAWPPAIEAVLQHQCSTLRTLTLLRETASTQDIARAAGAPVGAVYVAWQQTRGRGRLGRAWADTGEEGVALTAVVPSAAPERLAIASAVAAADAVAACGGAAARVGIKWPNDLVLDGRKLAGILVEQCGARALIGVGINVSQREFPEPPGASAISLLQAGVMVDRAQVICQVIRSLDEWLARPLPDLERAYRQRDQFSGLKSAFRTPAGVVQGQVISVDPSRGLLVATATGEQFLPAATTSVVPPTP